MVIVQPIWPREVDEYIAQGWEVSCVRRGSYIIFWAFRDA